MDNYIGKRLDGRYEIHQLIGVGGMAYVYRAYDNLESRWVAIKILKDEFSENSEFLKRFINESKAIAVLSHQNIVKVYDVSFGDRIQYIVMEYIDGINLKDYISRNGALPWKETLYFTAQILKALQHAHSNGIIHRDIKPQNIMLLQNGVIKVTDFGIARFSQAENHQTVTDKALGSVHYIAPEQAKGEFTSEKADIYSVGVMMYEMLTGQLPFEADNAVSVAIMQLQVEPAKPRSINPQIPVGLEEITMKAMEKNPAMRFASAAEMLHDIEAFHSNPNITFGYSYQQDFSATRQVDLYDEFHSTKRSFSETAPVYEDDFEYEVELEKSKKRNRGRMILTGIILALFCVIIGLAGIIGYSYFSSPTDIVSDEVLLPSFIGMNYDTEILGNDEYKDFRFVVEESFADGKENGVVLSQSPTGGKSVKKGKEVVIYINRLSSDSRTPLVMPDFYNTAENNAFNTLQAQGLVPVVEKINDDSVANGYVIRTEPAAEETVYSGDTVRLIVSNGPSAYQVTVPYLVDCPLSVAESLLTDSGLVLGSVTYLETSDYDEGTVISCSPDVYSSVSEGSSVNVVVAKGSGTSESSVTVPLSIDLPEDIDQDLALKIYMNGELNLDTTVNPYYYGSYSITFEGNDNMSATDVLITLDDQDYVTCTIDYLTASVINLVQYDFVN